VTDMGDAPVPRISELYGWPEGFVEAWVNEKGQGETRQRITPGA
jgi:hypothetical protein